MLGRLFLSLLFCAPAFGQTIALTDADITGVVPGAIGHGRYAIGPEAPAPYLVSNASDFKTAVESATPYTIIFRAGGTYEYANTTSTYELRMSGSKYIAGQTAPGGGVSLQGDGLRIMAGEFVMRHVRSRGDDQVSTEGEDALRVFPTSSKVNVIVDHCSISIGGDANFDFADLTGVTASYNIVSNGDPYGTLLQEPIADVTFYGNLYVWNKQRTIRVSTSSVEFEFINNLIYGTGDASYSSYEIMNMSWQNRADIIGNVYENYISNGSPSGYVIGLSAGNSSPPSAAATVLYHSDNTFDGVAMTTSNYIDPEFADGTIAGTPQYSSGITALSSSLVEAHVLANAGAGNGVQGLDTYDASLIDDVQTDQATGWIDPTVFTYPTLATGTPYADSDSDGLSDAYESSNGGSISWSTQPTTAVLTNGTTIDQTAVTAASRYNHGAIFLAELAGDWDNFTPTGGGTNNGKAGPIKKLTRIIN